MSLDGDPTRAIGSRPPVQTLPPGAVVGHWRVVRHLATGGFGVVYEVAHQEQGTRGALKVLHAHLLASPEMVARLVREAEVIAELHHPNIVELLEAATDAQGQPYLVMEYLEGRDLAHAIAERGRFAPAEVLQIVEPLCAAVATAHEHGVVHRDIKASNVMLSDSAGGARVVLLDFGIAKLLDHGGAELTASRQALGTPSSMAPEQIRGEHVDQRADVYALGALTFHLLTGRMPFEDASMTMSQYMHLHAARPRPSASAPLDPRIDAVVIRAMAIDPARRHGDALAFYAALRTAMSESAGSAGDEQEVTAVLVRAVRTVDDDDEALFDDLDTSAATAESVLSARGFSFARDLGDASLFIAVGLDAEGASHAAVAVWHALATRATRDPRVRVTVWMNRARARLVDGRVEGGSLADPTGWGLPDHEGLWIVGANTTRADIG